MTRVLVYYAVLKKDFFINTNAWFSNKFSYDKATYIPNNFVIFR